MLTELPDDYIDEHVWRVALSTDRHNEIEQIKRDVGDGPELIEALDFLLDPMTMSDPSLDVLLTIPFTNPRPSRFSDGSFGVLYTSRERETASSEVANYLPEKFPTAAGQVVRVRYNFISCRVIGRVKDLRPAVLSNKWLIGDDHLPCRAIGLEARSLQLNALLAESARRPGGTNVPVFDEVAAREPQHEGDVLFVIEHGVPVTFEFLPKGSRPWVN
jgi:hypothetical protein